MDAMGNDSTEPAAMFLRIVANKNTQVLVVEVRFVLQLFQETKEFVSFSKVEMKFFCIFAK